MSQERTAPLIADLLVRGMDDWVHDAEVFGSVAARVATDQADRRAVAIGLITAVVLDGLMIPGDLRDGEFVDWPGTPAESAARIAQKWLGRSGAIVLPGEVCWLRNSAAGDERAASYLGELSAMAPTAAAGETAGGEAPGPAAAGSQLQIVTIDVERSSLDASLPASLTSAGVVAYLTAAPLVLSARGQVEDQRDPTAKRIPIGFRSDGAWVWSLEAERYVERDGMPLPEAFLGRIAQLGTPPELSDERRHEIVAFITSGGRGA